MTLLVIRHASPSAPRPQLPAQLSGHRVLCSDCASLSEVRQCLCQPQARSADWVLLDVGAADDNTFLHMSFFTKYQCIRR